MKNYEIQNLTDSQLIERTEYLVRRERELVECLITHLQEIQNRKLYIPMGYTSLFECLIKHFKYSESIAYSRISVLKIMREVPEIIKDLQTGELNITHLTLAQSYFRSQEKQMQEKVSAEEKRQIMACLKNATTKEAKQILAEKVPLLELPPDQIRHLDSNHIQIQMTANKAILEKIESLKNLISHENVNPSLCEIFDLSLTAAIEALEKKKGLHYSQKRNADRPQAEAQKKNTQENKLDAKEIKQNTKQEKEERERDKTVTPTQSFADRNSRYISRKVRQAVLKRADHRCEHIHASGERCSSKFQLQFDHIKPHSKGGNSEYSNIQVLCRVHNAYKSNQL